MYVVPYFFSSHCCVLAVASVHESFKSSMVRYIGWGCLFPWYESQLSAVFWKSLFKNKTTPMGRQSIMNFIIESMHFSKADNYIFVSMSYLFYGVRPPKTHRVHSDWQRSLSGVYSIMMEKLAQAGEGGGCTLHPLSLYLASRTKLQCKLQLREHLSRYTHPISSLPFVLCVRLAEPCSRVLMSNICVYKWWSQLWVKMIK